MKAYTVIRDIIFFMLGLAILLAQFRLIQINDPLNISGNSGGIFSNSSTNNTKYN